MTPNQYLQLGLTAIQCVTFWYCIDGFIKAYKAKRYNYNVSWALLFALTTWNQYLIFIKLFS